MSTTTALSLVGWVGATTTRTQCGSGPALLTQHLVPRSASPANPAWRPSNVALPQLSQPNILACDQLQLLSPAGGPLDVPGPGCRLYASRLVACVSLFTWLPGAQLGALLLSMNELLVALVHLCDAVVWAHGWLSCHGVAHPSASNHRRRLGAAPSGYASFKLRARHSGALVFPTVGYPLHDKRPPFFFFFLLVPKEAT